MRRRSSRNAAASSQRAASTAPAGVPQAKPGHDDDGHDDLLPSPGFRRLHRSLWLPSWRYRTR
jgi:hypothetical protein